MYRHFHLAAQCYNRCIRNKRSYTKIPDSRQVASSPADAENLPFLQRNIQRLSYGKAPQHETDPFMHVRGLLYKHVMDSSQKFLGLVILKSWKYTVLVEAHDKLGHQGNTHTYCLIKCQYYWKGMNKDIRKYIANCMLCHRDKAKVQAYPLQLTRDSRQTIQQNHHRSSHGMQNLKLLKQAHSSNN